MPVGNQTQHHLRSNCRTVEECDDEQIVRMQQLYRVFESWLLQRHLKMKQMFFITLCTIGSGVMRSPNFWPLASTTQFSDICAWRMAARMDSFTECRTHVVSQNTRKFFLQVTVDTLNEITAVGALRLRRAIWDFVMCGRSIRALDGFWQVPKQHKIQTCSSAGKREKAILMGEFTPLGLNYCESESLSEFEIIPREQPSYSKSMNFQIPDISSIQMPDISSIIDMYEINILWW